MNRLRFFHLWCSPTEFVMMLMFFTDYVLNNSGITHETFSYRACFLKFLFLAQD